MPNPHEASAAAGIASRSIASTELTILKGHVIFLIGAYSRVSLAGCDGNHTRSQLASHAKNAEALKQQTMTGLDDFPAALAIPHVSNLLD
jgi:hypothetical protein